MFKRHQQRTDGSLRAARWLAPIAALSMLGCPNEDLAPLEPCTVSGVSNEVPVTGVDMVDLLFVIDDSNSMAQEQAKLAAQLPKLVRILTSGIREGDTMPSFTPVRDLHLGVVTSDMGTNGLSIPELQRSRCDKFGRDGILLRQARADAGCAASTNGTGYLTYAPGSSNPAERDLEATIASFECLANVGVAGCGFEQQLEAMYKAVAPSDVTFAGGTRGHGGPDGANRGFLRSEAVLAVIQVSDEEDCSVTDRGTELFNSATNDPVISVGGKPLGFNIRCAYGNPSERVTQVEKAGYIYPVERYFEDFKAKVKPLNPDRIIFAAIVGIPDGTEELSFDEILQHERMGFAVDPITGSTPATLGDPTDGQVHARDVCRRCYGASGAACDALHPVTNVADIETGAKPAVRFVKVAKGFGDNGLVRSICAESFAPAVDTIIEKISKQLKGACLPRELNPNAQGIVECDVVEILEPGKGPEACTSARGRRFLETRDGRTVCSINQAAVQGNSIQPNPNPLEGVQANVGWYYDTFSPKVMEECPPSQRRRISFTDGAEPNQATVKFECFQPVVSSEDQAIGKAAVNLSCEAAGISCEQRSDPTDGFTLVCEPSSKTCQIGCQQDTHCPVGWVCDSGENGSNICLNPTCLPPNLR